MTRFVICAAAVALALTASTASAEVGTMRVRVGDLNLQSDAGAMAAFARIRQASTTFCGGDGSTIRDLQAIYQQGACQRRMTSQAVGVLNAPKVTALSGDRSTPIHLAAAR